MKGNDAVENGAKLVHFILINNYWCKKVLIEGVKAAWFMDGNNGVIVR